MCKQFIFTVHFSFDYGLLGANIYMNKMKNACFTIEEIERLLDHCRKAH